MRCKEDIVCGHRVLSSRSLLKGGREGGREGGKNAVEGRNAETTFVVFSSYSCGGRREGGKEEEL